jgi:hypothetical protein
MNLVSKSTSNVWFENLGFSFELNESILSINYFHNLETTKKHYFYE